MDSVRRLWPNICASVYVSVWLVLVDMTNSLWLIKTRTCKRKTRFGLFRLHLYIFLSSCFFPLVVLSKWCGVVVCVCVVYISMKVSCRTCMCVCLKWKELMGCLQFMFIVHKELGLLLYVPLLIFFLLLLLPPMSVSHLVL